MNKPVDAVQAKQLGKPDSLPSTARPIRQQEPAPVTYKLSICQAKDCRKLGAKVVYDHAKGQLYKDIQVISCYCLSNCDSGPSVRISTGQIISHVTTPQLLDELVASFYPPPQEMKQEVSTSEAES